MPEISLPLSLGDLATLRMVESGRFDVEDSVGRHTLSELLGRGYLVVQEGRLTVSASGREALRDASSG